MFQTKDGNTCVGYSTNRQVDGRPIASGWNIALGDVQEFLKMADLQTIVALGDDDPQQYWSRIYRKSDIREIAIWNGNRIVGSFYRLDMGNFIFQPSYNISQSDWENIYPDPCERAQLKLETKLFYRHGEDKIPEWYFIGKSSGRLYHLNGDAQISFAGTPFNRPDLNLRETGIKDGLSAAEFCQDLNFFKGEALKQTEYSQHKIDSVAQIITLAAMCASEVVDLIRQILTETEFIALTAA